MLAPAAIGCTTLPMSTPYLITVSPTAMSFSATLWPIGMSCAHSSAIVRSSSRISPVSGVPALTPSTTTTATESFGSCNTQWIIGDSCERCVAARRARRDAGGDARSNASGAAAVRSQLDHLYHLRISCAARLPRTPARRASPRRMTDTAAPGVPLAAPLYREIAAQHARTRSPAANGSRARRSRPSAGWPTRFGVSIGTVRKAIDELVAANLLIRQQGRGTFVASHNRDRLLFYFFHVVPERRARSSIPTSGWSRSRAARPTAPRPSGCASRRRRRSSASATCCTSTAIRSSSTTSRCRLRASRA